MSSDVYASARGQWVEVIQHHQTVAKDEQYRQISNISRTKFQNLNVSRLVLQLYFAQSIEARF